MIQDIEEMHNLNKSDFKALLLNLGIRQLLRKLRIILEILFHYICLLIKRWKRESTVLQKLNSLFT